MENEEITISFEVEGLPPSPNETKGLHWSKLEKIKKEWMQQVAAAALVAKHRAKLKGAYSQCRIMFEISVGDRRRHDPDNLMWAVTKPTLDALTPTRDPRTDIPTDGLLLEDDSIDHIELSYKFTRDPPRRFKVTMTGR